MKVLGLFVLALSCAWTLFASATGVRPNQTPLSVSLPRTVFVQLFEWPWEDVARECELYLGPAGFAAVQVSPPQEHLSWPNHPWWERYQPVSYQIFSRSGDRASFRNMVQRCQNVGVDVYADVVFNHMAGMASGEGFAGTKFEHYNYPGLFGYNDFHHCGRNGNDDIGQFQDAYELFNCELLNLADLKTESSYVRDEIRKYLSDLLSLGVAGFRVDAAKHIPPQDIDEILAGVKGSFYVFHELILNPGEPLSYRDYMRSGDVMAYYYPFGLAEAFKWKRAHLLPAVGLSEIDSEHAIVFVENHDLQRVRERSGLLSSIYDGQLYRLAQVFMLAWPFGYPQVFSGYAFADYDQGPPLNVNLFTDRVLDGSGRCRTPFTCEHRDAWVTAMVWFRNFTNGNFYATHWWSNGQDQLSFARGSSGFVVVNFSANVLTRQFVTDFAPGEVCDLLSSDLKTALGSVNCGRKFKVARDGLIQLSVPPMSAVVLAPSATVTRTRNATQ